MAVEPSQEQLQRVAEAARDGERPLVMLNLNRYRDRDAYLRYAEVALEVLADVGARVLSQGPVEQPVIGESEDAYEEVIAVWYPSAAAFLRFVADPRVAEARAHRLEGLERATVLWCDPRAVPASDP